MKDDTTKSTSIHYYDVQVLEPYRECWLTKERHVKKEYAEQAAEAWRKPHPNPSIVILAVRIVECHEVARFEVKR